MEELIKQRELLVKELIKITYNEWASPNGVLKAIEATDQLLLKLMTTTSKVKE